MKPILFFLFLFTLLTACNSDDRSMKQFKTIDFSYFNISPEAFSMRVTQRDSVFVKQYFSSEGQLKDSITYFGFLKGDIKENFDSLIALIDFTKFETVYETGHIDGDEYSIYYEGDTISKQLHVHSMRPPKELEFLKKLFLGMKRSLAFVPVDTIINFRANPPEPPPFKGESSR